MELTTQQLEAIDAGEAVAVFVDETHCVILRQDVYERIRPGSEGLPSEIVAELVQGTMADYDADDPLLDSYQQVD